MTRREFLIGGAAAAAQAAPARRRRPNVLLIVADDLGWGELFQSDDTDIPLPNLMSLAREGTHFTDGYVTAPVCSPSRAGLLTGRYQTRFGHELNPLGAQNLERGIGLPVGEKTLPELLKPQGYATGIVGKWHLGATDPYHPMRRGFDEFFGFLQEGHSYVPPPYAGVTSWLNVNSLPGGGKGHLRHGNYIFSTDLNRTEDDYDDRNPLLRGSTPVTESGYLTDVLAREASAFIDRHAAEPFFLYLPFSAPHCPMQAPQKYMERFRHIADVQRRIFAGMAAAMDDAVGTVLGKLREKGIEQDTLVFFLSDNGGNTRELTSSNGKLRAGKGSLHEGGIRVPFAVQWKGRIPAGRRFTQPVISLDIVATALAAAGVARPHNLDGVDLLPFLTGAVGRAPHDDLFWRYGASQALRSGNWKLLRQGGAEGRLALFDLANDLGEDRDVAAGHPELVARLSRRMQEYDGRMVSPLWRTKVNRPQDWPLQLIGQQ